MANVIIFDEDYNIEELSINDNTDKKILIGGSGSDSQDNKGKKLLVHLTNPFNPFNLFNENMKLLNEQFESFYASIDKIYMKMISREKLYKNPRRNYQCKYREKAYYTRQFKRSRQYTETFKKILTCGYSQTGLPP